MSDGPLFQRAAILGIGLIGSSLARVIRTRGLAVEIVGFDASPEVRRRAEVLELCDRLADTPADAVAGADLVLLCVPVGANAEVAEAMAPGLATGAIVSDVGSVKLAVVRDVGPWLPEGVHFVPGHPLAGTEHSGPDAGFADLFDNRWCILTPLPDTDEAAVAQLRAFWESLGARVESMDAAHHDLVLAVTSHVPHAIAYTMCGVADDMARVTDQEVVQYSAAGFRDFTRIAASDPVMWRDVFLANKGATIEILGRFVEELMSLQRAIRTGDGDHLLAYFTRTRAIRRSIIEAGQDVEAPDFGRAPKRPCGR